MGVDIWMVGGAQCWNAGEGGEGGVRGGVGEFVGSDTAATEIDSRSPREVQRSDAREGGLEGLRVGMRENGGARG